MLHNYAPIEGSDHDQFLKKKTRKHLFGRSRPYVNVLCNFILGQRAMPRGPAFSEWYFID